MKLRNAALIVILGLGLGLTACEKKEESPVEETTEGVKDALDMREHEEFKDAAEDAESAMDNAAEGIEDTAEDAADATEDAAEEAADEAEDAAEEVEEELEN